MQNCQHCCTFQVEDWKRTQGPVLLHHAIVHKFVQNPELRARLLETGTALLAHTYERDNIFAAGCDKEKMLEWAKNNNGHIIKVSLFSLVIYECSGKHLYLVFRLEL